MNKIIFVSAGMIRKKKEHQATSLYLNYGFLGLASIVSENYDNVCYYQGDIYSPKKLFNLLRNNKFITNNYPIFLSIPSFYAVSWAEEFSELLKTYYPTTIIIAGGRWVVKDNMFIEHNLKYIDYFINGQAEDIILDLLSQKKTLLQNKYISNTNYNQVTPNLNYKIMDNFLEYTAAIELSRGCGMGCSFCEDKDVKLTKIKDPEILLQEIIKLKKLYNDNHLKFYFQSSIFNPTNQWVDDFLNLYNINELTIQWRCETRVDTLSENKIPKLAKSGLKVIDLGLESASKQQLKLMHKTNSPDTYLSLASKLLKVCFENNIWVKVNILLYPGETHKTIEETINWLKEHKQYIKGISAYPLMIFGTDNHSLAFLNDIEYLGAKSISNKIDSSGITKLDLSNEISHKDSLKIALDISREFMSIQDYYDLKSFGYFKRTYKYTDFLKSISTIDKKELPFTITS